MLWDAYDDDIISFINAHFIAGLVKSVDINDYYINDIQIDDKNLLNLSANTRELSCSPIPNFMLLMALWIIQSSTDLN